MNPNKPPMKNNQKSSPRVSALQITFISLLAVFLTLSGAPAQKRLEKKPTGANIALDSDRQHEHRTLRSLSDAATLRQDTGGGWIRYDHRGVVRPSDRYVDGGRPAYCTPESHCDAAAQWQGAARGRS